MDELHQPSPSFYFHCQLILRRAIAHDQLNHIDSAVIITDIHASVSVLDIIIHHILNGILSDVGIQVAIMQGCATG